MSETPATNGRSQSDTAESTIRYYGVYLAVALLLFGVLFAATQTGSLILTLIAFALYGGWCMYYIAVKQPRRREKLTATNTHDNDN